MIATRSPVHHTHLYRVCWESVTGDCQGRGRPMVKDLAEFVAHDEELGQPMRRYWVEACFIEMDDKADIQGS